jgi:hypothetical protein
MLSSAQFVRCRSSKNGESGPFLRKTIKEANQMKNEITITGQGRVISKHASGVTCVYDSRHRILNVPLEGGVIAELVQERTGSDTIYCEYRNQLLTVVNGRDATVIEF